MREDIQDRLRETIESCSELIARMQAGEQEALDTARGMLWKWVDEGDFTQLTNLMAAIRLLSQVTLESMEEEDADRDAPSEDGED